MIIKCPEFSTILYKRLLCNLETHYKLSILMDDNKAMVQWLLTLFHCFCFFQVQLISTFRIWINLRFVWYGFVHIYKCWQLYSFLRFWKRNLLVQQTQYILLCWLYFSIVGTESKSKAKLKENNSHCMINQSTCIFMWH